MLSLVYFKAEVQSPSISPHTDPQLHCREESRQDDGYIVSESAEHLREHRSCTERVGGHPKADIDLIL